MAGGQGAKGGGAAPRGQAPPRGEDDDDDYVILVDSNDTDIGTAGKTECHLPDGRLHRAFTALLFDRTGRLLLTRRSSSKMLWPGDWDGTVASHPRRGETYVSSAQRRLPEEIGLGCSLEYLFKFEYHAPYGDVGSENEICGTLAGVVGDGDAPSPVDSEISETAWLDAGDPDGIVSAHPARYCPWMLIALYLLPESGQGALGRHGGILGKWTGQAVRASLRGAIRAHLGDDRWRLAGR